MILFETKKDYIDHFKTIFTSDNTVLNAYFNNQVTHLNQLTQEISQETFWQLFPEILGIDAKLTLLTELIQFDEFSNEEILRIVENDYRSYFKELCGYDLITEPKHSMIFNVV
ncbi:hypothetical protein ACFDAA_18085 [Enterococcus casseliflavus]|uniref:DUF7006 family protein n=1 Tax=Enterococcus casseliflavus TaxID=37734 RepID=UPI0039A543E4